MLRDRSVVPREPRDPRCIGRVARPRRPVGPALTLVCATLLGLGLGLASVVPAAAEDPRVTLTPGEVFCNGEQLVELVGRMEVLDPRGNLPGAVHSLFVSYSNRHGFYDGLVVGMPRFRPTAEPPVTVVGPGPEHQLGFHVNPSVRELLLNPERTPLAQVSLAREASTSNLVTVPVGGTNPFAAVVALNPTLGGHGPGDLVIDNLLLPPPDPTVGGVRPADTKPGRGLSEEGLTTPCHDRFTDLDRRIFSILQRTLRVELHDPARGLRYDTRIALFRDEDPAEYRATVFPVDPETGERRAPLHVTIRVETDESGYLTSGHLSVASPELVDYPVEGRVAIVRPLFGGVDREYLAEVSYPVGTPLPAAPESFWDFDWRDVLADTAWNEGREAVRQCGQGTAEELAATPRDDPNRELLALAVAGGLTADQEVYDRLGRDLTAIRRMTPAVAEARYLPATDGKSLFLVADSAATYRAIERGEYREWDCLNDWYGLEQVVTEAAFPETHPWVSVRLKGTYDLDRIAPEYGGLPGIESANPDGVPYPAVLLPSLCVTAEGSLYHYFFDVVSAAAFTTFYFTTSRDGSVDLVGVYDPRSLEPAPPPDWLGLHERCLAEQRVIPPPPSPSAS